MPKRKVGPLLSANNSFVNTLMNRCKFMKKIIKYRTIVIKLQALKYYENTVNYHAFYISTIENDFKRN